MTNKSNPILIGVMTFVLGSLLLLLIKEIISTPRIIHIIDSDSRYFCPLNLYSMSDSSTNGFDLMYKNIGAGAGVFTVKLFSDDILFKQEGEEYYSSDVLSLYLESGQIVDYKFGIRLNKSNGDITNFTINILENCKYKASGLTLSCGPKDLEPTTCCNYVEEGYYRSNNFKLISEKCR